MQQGLTGNLLEGKSGGESLTFITQSPNDPSWSENSCKPAGIPGNGSRFLEFSRFSCALCPGFAPILPLLLDLGCAAPHGAHPSNSHLPELLTNRNSPDAECPGSQIPYSGSHEVATSMLKLLQGHSRGDTSFPEEFPLLPSHETSPRNY